ncbi:hypothetical protein ILUMI_13740 [Ignelater luminosus]|uniref:Cytochrome P450 n=1 Tax=Ignelater luminosus TaxID=2038154 RepID=A0A8K0CRT2_IGNLU|nr:hypothetical protein ILUMI_13740 [Ignelater luminosus]
MFQNLYEYAIILITISIGLLTLLRWKFSYWSRKNVPFIPGSIPFGSIGNPFKPSNSLGVLTKIFYQVFKALGHKHGGFYNLISPIYIPVDPDLVKNILQKDFSHFVDRGTYHNEHADPLSGHLFAIGGEKWRTLRTKLTPTFTTGKMKMMFDTLVQCSEPMRMGVEKLTEKKEAVDIKEIVASFTTDVIGSCAFGLDCNSFKDEEAEFRKNGRRIFQRSKLEFFRFLIFQSVPNFGQLLNMRFFPKEVTDFFLNVVKDTVKYRENNNVTRNDMLQLLIEMKNKDKNNNTPTLSVTEIGAQAFVFFIAGFETSSTTMTFCLYELARDPELQEKVRDEINNVLKKHNNEITYESMTEMKYMTQVIEETLRKYPPLTAITRNCVKNYKVPDTDVTIDKGTKVFIPILGLHHDPEYYPDPEKFDPERFSVENKINRHPFTYIPFGEGPRICIGLRFGIMQTKVGLTVLLKNYRFSLNHKSRVSMKVDPYSNSFIYSNQDTVWLDSERINNS